MLLALRPRGATNVSPPPQPVCDRQRIRTDNTGTGAQCWQMPGKRAATAESERTFYIARPGAEVRSTSRLPRWPQSET